MRGGSAPTKSPMSRKLSPLRVRSDNDATSAGDRQCSHPTMSGGATDQAHPEGIVPSAVEKNGDAVGVVVWFAELLPRLADRARTVRLQLG